MPTTVIPFWKELTRRREAKKLTAAELARRLGVSPQTFASWKARGQFRRSALPALAEVLDWRISAQAAETKQRCELTDERVTASPAERHPVETALRQADRAYRRAIRAFSRYADSTPILLRALGENSFFAFSAATSSPYEFEETPEGRATAREVAGAIARGALCFYIRPTEEGVRYYEETWGYGRVVRHDEAKREMQEFRNRVRQLLTTGAVGPRIAAEKADRWLFERLDQCYITRSPMWMPGIGLGMAGWAHARDLKARATLSLPGGKFGGLLIYPQYYALEYRFGRVLRFVVTRACEEMRRITSGLPSEGHVLLDVPDARRAQANQFYTKLDQMLRTVSSIEPPLDALDSTKPPPPPEGGDL